MSTGIYRTPGFTPRAAAGSAFSAGATPAFKAPTRPADISARMRPGTQVQESGLLRRATTIGQKYQPLRTAQIGNTRAALQRFGGYNVKDDGSITTDPNARPGQAYRDAYGAERDAANARGVMDSSFAAKAIGSSWGRLSAEAQSIVTQHASSFNQIIASEAQEYDDINQSLLGLYGEEAQWMLDNPPEMPAAPQPAAGGGGGGATAPGDGSPIVWKGSGYPNLASLQARHPGQQLGVRRAGDGSYVVVIGSGNAQRPGMTPPRPSQVVNGGRPTGRTGTGNPSLRYF